MVAESSGSGWAILILVVVGYFVPTLVAYGRKVSSVGSIVVVNVFLGWTLIGWVVALAMAARSVQKPERVTP